MSKRRIIHWLSFNVVAVILMLCVLSVSARVEGMPPWAALCLPLAAYALLCVAEYTSTRQPK